MFGALCHRIVLVLPCCLLVILCENYLPLVHSAAHHQRPSIVLKAKSNFSDVANSVLSLFESEEESNNVHSITTTEADATGEIFDEDSSSSAAAAVNFRESKSTKCQRCANCSECQKCPMCSKRRQSKTSEKKESSLDLRDILQMLLSSMPRQASSLNIHLHLSDNNKPKNEEDRDTTYEVTDKSLTKRPDKCKTCYTKEDNKQNRKRRQISIFPTPYNWDFMKWRPSRPRFPPQHPPQESMKRVIFTRCPFYPCPSGYICDHHSHSCRSLFFPDYDDEL